MTQSPLKWEWMSDNSCCFASPEPKLEWELDVIPCAADCPGIWHGLRRGPYRIEVLKVDGTYEQCVTETFSGRRRYATIKEARAAAVRLWERVR